ncbi:hypothetical protein Tco_0909899 [Tanacetum coccineum]|uniref:Uncharacterized protein n=1 Tax=Tanacetum coccineum TaxID=301880 RepID=A0ABQ5CXM5_9ASTR
MWEEFTQSIHNYTEDKRNLAQQAQGKKKATLILIPSIRFTKLIIFHLQRLHNFHPRPESPLHLPTEEPVLGNLKFSAKGTKQEVFRMTIPNELINDDIRGADYYDAYLEKKKRKPVSESSEAPLLAKCAKAGKVVKKRIVKSSKQLVDEFVDEGIPAAKPSLEDTEEAILQKVLEESLTDAYPTQRGPLPLVVFRETDTGKFQPLPKVPGKGKEKVDEEQAAQVLLHLQTTKKKIPTKHYIFQRHTPVPSEPAGHEESSSLYAELGLSGSNTDSDEEIPSVVRSGAQDEDQARPEPSKLDEGQAGQNPDDVAESQPLPTPSVLVGPNLEHSDVEITDPSSQPQPEHMDEGFTAAAYPNVQENLKLTVDEQTDNEKTTADTKAESIVSITVQQDTSITPPMMSLVIGPMHRPDSPNVYWPLPTTTTTTSATTTTTLPLPPQPQQGPFDPIIIKCMGELDQHITDLVEENQALEKRLNKQGDRIHKLETMDWPKMIREQTVEFIDSQEIDQKINESVKEDSIRRDECKDFDVDKAQEETKKKSKQDSLKPPPGSPHSPPPPPPPPSGTSGASGITRASDSAQAPPPPPPSSSTHQEDQSTSIAAPSSSKTTTTAEYSTWTTFDTWIKPLITPIPDDLYMDDETTINEQAYSSGDEVGCDHIPTVNLRQRISELTPKDLEGPAYEIVKVFHTDVVNLQFQMEECHKLLTDKVDDAILQYNVSKPLPLGGEPGHITIQSNFFFNKDLEQRFYIDRFSSEGDRRAVRNHMRILSVIQIEVFSMYGYNYMKKIVLHRSDLKEYVIAERDFKYMYPSDFEDLDRYAVQMIMRFNEIHKFSDGTLQHIDEALDYRVKEFRVNRTNPGMNTRFWTKKDVVRSKEFMFALQKRLKRRRIFQNLESFVGGRIQEGDYRLLKRTE